MRPPRRPRHRSCDGGSVIPQKITLLLQTRPPALMLVIGRVAMLQPRPKIRFSTPNPKDIPIELEAPGPLAIHMVRILANNS
eukprot:3585399-Pyramimonas_sp.AAC.1